MYGHWSGLESNQNRPWNLLITTVLTLPASPQLLKIVYIFSQSQESPLGVKLILILPRFSMP